MEFCIHQDTPPEKYYEACITYHLVRYFERMYNRRLYPFSVSQIQEKQLGFDFGYEVSLGNVFLAQFKRPYGKGKRGIIWQIKKEQAAVLAKQPVRAYYVLPTFLKQEEWYEGLDKTFFVPAGAVYTWARSRKAEQSALLYEDERVVTVSDSKCFDPFDRGLRSALHAEPDFRTEEFVKQIQGVTEDQVCGYWIGGEVENGTWQLH